MEATYAFPDRLMLDPSLLAAGNTAGRTLTEMEENRAGFQFYLPQTFVGHLVETDWLDGKPAVSELPPVVRYYVSRTTPANLNRVAEELAGDRELFQTFEASDYADQYFDLYQTLHAILPYARDRQKQEQEPYYGESQDLLTDAVFEELVFLSEMSGLVSRVKRIITHAIEAGFTVIETSQEVYEQGIQPHLKDSDQVKKDVCKELGNWMVTGLGGAAVGMIGGPLAGVVTAGMIKTGTNLAFLLVIDPP